MRLETITHDQLRYNPAINARGDTETDLAELAATIKSQGLGQPLLVRPAGNSFEPVEGGRRFRAIGQLIAAGDLAADYQIPVLIRELSDAEAIELSLATAVTRVPLNPADEAVSFQTLVDKGTVPEDIAAHFGIPLRRVKQRLAIANLPSEIIAALRQNEISLETAQAFTIGRDHRAISKVFAEAAGSHPSYIRAQLLQKRVAADSREASYVGLEAYKAAGGAVDEDLFSRDVWLGDAKLLAKLVDRKLKDDEKAFLKDGWSFVIIETDPYATKYQSWPHLMPEGKPSLTIEQTARLAELKAEMKALRKAKGNTPEWNAAMQKADDEYEALSANHFTAAQKKKAGVLILYRPDKIEIIAGIMKPAAARKETKAKASAQKAKDPGPQSSGVRKVEDAEADFTQALNAEMAKAMTEAMQDTIPTRPGLAKRALTAALLCITQHGRASPFEISGAGVVRSASPEFERIIADERRPFQDARGDLDAARVFAELRKVSDERCDAICARVIAWAFACHHQIDPGLEPLTSAFLPDVNAVWEPGEDFYKRMGRDALAAALGEAAIPGVTPSKKKKELVEMALRSLPPLGWLPRPLRTPAYKGPGSNSWADAHAAKLADEVVQEQQQAAE
jgi:ParB family chromosome partitioning protein